MEANGQSHTWNAINYVFFFFFFVVEIIVVPYFLSCTLIFHLWSVQKSSKATIPVVKNNFQLFRTVPTLNLKKRQTFLSMCARACVCVYQVCVSIRLKFTFTYLHFYNKMITQNCWDSSKLLIKYVYMLEYIFSYQKTFKSYFRNE